MNSNHWKKLASLILLLVILLGCQAGKVDSALDVNQETPDGADTISTNHALLENFGTGSTSIYMILHRSTDRNAASFRNGAILAAEDLGVDQVALTIVDATSETAQPANLVAALKSAKTRMLVVDGGKDTEQTASKISADMNIPVISLTQAAPAGVYAFKPTGIDSITAAIGYALNQGKQNIAVFAEQGNAAAKFNAIREKIGKRDFSLLEVPYKSGLSAGSIIRKNAKLLSSADVFVLTETDASTAKLASSAKTLVGAKADRIVIVRNDLPASIMANPALNGAITAIPDTAHTQLIQERYQKKFNAKPDLNAAYAYDAMAIAVGLSRAKGGSAINRTNLQTPTGFKATTGAFRFLPDGKVERIFAIARINGGKLETITPAKAGF